MEWNDIALIVFISVTINHLGLVKAAEKVVGFPLFIINCCKCLSFWYVLIHCKINHCGWIDALAISFLASYSAIWLELFEGYIDTIYDKVYEKIYTRAENNETATSGNESDTDSTMS